MSARIVVTICLLVSFSCLANELVLPGGGGVPNTVVTSHPADELAHYGLALARSNRFGAAVSAITHALSQSTDNNSQYLRDLALVYTWRGNYDAAIVQMNNAISLDHDNPELIDRRANILTWNGDLAGAVNAYKELVDKHPDNDAYWIKLGQAYLLQNRIHDAHSSYEMALHLNPDNKDVYLGLAHLYETNHQFSEAKDVLRDGLTKHPDDMSLSYALAELVSHNALSQRQKLELGELAIFTIIILILALDIWRDRRTLRRRKLTLHVLLPGLLALASLVVVVAVNIMYSGTYYKQILLVAQILEPLALGILFTLTLIWRFRFERPQRQKTVLAIGAHPDDIEFGCGATLLRMREEGAATYGLVLTGGEHGHDISDTDSVRIEEARSAAEVMALCDIRFHSFPDTSLHEHKAEIRHAIEDALKRWRPDIIFTHNSHDVHTDHHTVYDATREAARGACTILCYENPNTPPTFKPGLFYDIGKYLDGKIAALKCHKTQMTKSYAASSVVHAIAGFRGTQARVPYAEGFEVMRVLEKARD